MSELHKPLITEEQIAKSVSDIVNHQRQIVDNYCKALLAKFGGDENEIRNNLERMVIHNEMGCAMPVWEQTWWVSFDAKMSCGDWQPIESAPKDRPVIVSVSPSDGLPGFVTVCQWHKDAGWCADELRPVKKWMPLPEPPEE